MIEESLIVLLQFRGMNPHHLISQTILQPLLERDDIPTLWLRHTSRFYQGWGCPTPQAAPIVGILHPQQHFIAIYISQEYWTLSDPLFNDPTQRHLIRRWERHLHSSLAHIHNTLNLPAPTLPRFRLLPNSLST